jgi:hypothetical protein
MLNNPSEKIRECYHEAEDFARKAAAETDPQLKRDFLASERQWLLLARSYEFNSRLTDFSAWATRRAAPPRELYYALHTRLKDGDEQTEYDRRGELPKLGEVIPITLSDKRFYVRVLNVISAPSAKEPPEFAHYVYAVED